jgi:hypothetical protein
MGGTAVQVDVLPAQADQFTLAMAVSSASRTIGSRYGLHASW